MPCVRHTVIWNDLLLALRSGELKIFEICVTLKGETIVWTSSALSVRIERLLWLDLLRQLIAIAQRASKCADQRIELSTIQLELVSRLSL